MIKNIIGNWQLLENEPMNLSNNNKLNYYVRLFNEVIVLYPRYLCHLFVFVSSFFYCVVVVALSLCGALKPQLSDHRMTEIYICHPTINVVHAIELKPYKIKKNQQTNINRLIQK